MADDQAQALRGFAAVATEFCELIDSSDEFQRNVFFEKLAVSLARICEAGVLLPLVEPATDDAADGDSPKSHAERCVEISKRLKALLGDIDLYWLVFDATEPEEPTQSTLSNDLAEIYMDLRESLRSIQSDSEENDILWGCRFAFRTHWGRHASGALRFILSSVFDF